MRINVTPTNLVLHGTLKHGIMLKTPEMNVTPTRAVPGVTWVLGFDGKPFVQPMIQNLRLLGEKLFQTESCSQCTT